MGIIKNFFNKKEYKKEFDAISSNLYDEEVQPSFISKKLYKVKIDGIWDSSLEEISEQEKIDIRSIST